MHVVLVEPEIPQNTGSIGRTCSVTGTTLHLIRPLGFSLEDRYLRRAGLDYWQYLDVHVHDSLEEFLSAHASGRFLYASTHAKRRYCDIHYREGDFLVFGKETAGLPRALLEENQETAITIPIMARARSLNLANAVAVILFEAYRQLGFPYVTNDDGSEWF